jgi:hypothetical protein
MVLNVKSDAPVAATVSIVIGGFTRDDECDNVRRVRVGIVF